MCEICNGTATHDDYLIRIHLGIAEAGWHLAGVEPDARQPGWAYTIGLVESDHPEFVIVGLEEHAAAALLGHLAARVLDGEDFEAGEEVTIAPGKSVRFGSVHPAHLERGLLNTWAGYYRSIGRRSPELEVLQVVCSEGWFCACHRRSQPDLAEARSFVRDPNREERRRQQTRGRRRRR
jgi:hypothetical protein